MSSGSKLGFSVKIFIPTGEPDGLRIIEKSNWTGQGLVFPRSLFTEARQRSEIKRTGVYILWGPSDDSPLPIVYVGEGDGVLARFDQHEKKKEFWTHAVVFTSKDQNLNKAHVQFLESRLLELAREAKRCQLDNGNAPQLPGLSEADIADAEAFLADILLCLPLLGVSFFDKSKVAAQVTGNFTYKIKGITATGNDNAEGFIVQAGSLSLKEDQPSIQNHIRELRMALLKEGVLQDAGDHYRFAQAYTFGSPSTAAGVVAGTSVSGRIAWKDFQGRTLKEIQEAFE